MGDRSKELVTYLPASLLRAVAAQPGAEPGRAERKALIPFLHEARGTMVMADLSGFTAMSERLAKLGDEGAERLTSIINSFFEKMLQTASSFGGDVETFGGDAILLLFEGETHPDRAVAASLGMLKQVERSAAVDVGGGKIKIGMSVGAHSARFPLAGVGLPDGRTHALFIGHSAEVTALAEAQADRGQLGVSLQTREALSTSAETVAAGDFWRIESFERLVPSDPSVAADAYLPSLSEAQAQQLAAFLPPYAKQAGTGRDLSELTPEHRRVAVVFVNILGLNELVETQGQDVAVDQLQTYAAMLTRLCEKHRGFVVSGDIATKGSKLILTFGAPVAHEYSAANAARFALDLNAWLRDAGLDLRHRIGVNGGHVFAGEVGPSFRRQYTVMGDAVNLAARLMAAAPLGEVYVSRDLLDRAGPSLCGRELEPIKVKGKEQPVAVCVLEEETRAGRHVHEWERSAETQHGLFGRRAELELMKKAGEDVQAGTGRTLLLEGEAGVGKTRLLEEMLHGLPATVRVTQAACFEHLQAAPFTPWVDVLHTVLGIAPGDSKERRTRLVQERLARLPGSLDFAALLNPLLNLELPQSGMVASLDAQTRRRKLFDLIADVLTDTAQAQSLVLVIEDLHWMDESSMALTAHLTRRIGRAHVLLLLTTRPTETPLEVQSEVVTRVALAELSQAESLSMVRETLGVADLPAEVGEAIYAKTRGNPLFLEEVIHSLEAPGVLDRILGASSVKRAAELAALEIPDRVQGLLMSRVDRLAPDTREVLKAGSVVGRSFDRTVLAAIDDPLLAQVSFDRAFRELTEAALALPSEGDDATLTFRHALVQDVAYDSLPFSRRRRLHGEIARHIESVQTTPDHPLLVHHYSRAGEQEKTRVHAVRASEASVAVYSSLEAIDYLRLALDTAQEQTVRDACLRSRFEELMGDCQQMLGRHGEAIDTFLASRRRWASVAVRSVSADALRELSPIEDADARDSLLCWKTAVCMQRGPGSYRRAIRWLDMAMRTLPPDRPSLAARILIAKSVCLSRLNKNRESLELVERGLALARREEDLGLVAYGCNVRSITLSQLGQVQPAIESSREAVAAFEQVGDLAGQAISRSNLGTYYQMSDRPREALEQGELSLAMYARVGDLSGMAFQHLNVGACLIQLGELDEGLKHLEETVSSQDCPPFEVGWAYVLMTQPKLWMNDIEGAARAVARGREILERIEARAFLADTYIIEAEVHLAQGDAERAEQMCVEAVAEARSSEATPTVGEGLRILGRIRLAKGEPEAALADVQACLAIAQGMDSDFARGQALAMLAEAQAACDEGDPACEDLLGEAIRLFEKMGTGYDLKKALELRERLAARG